jgi:hypothetical protein
LRSFRFDSSSNWSKEILCLLRSIIALVTHVSWWRQPFFADRNVNSSTYRASLVKQLAMSRTLCPCGLYFSPRSYLYHIYVPYATKHNNRNMFDEKRRLTSIVYLSCLGSTMVIVFLPLPGAIKLITLLLLTLTQFCASVWYTLSYVPYGRRTMLRFIKSRLGLEETDYANVTLTG